METWKPIPEWEDRYAVSDAGRVKSGDMRVKAGKSGNGTATRKGRILAPVVKGGRYLCVTLARGERRVQCFVHDLVALAFLGPKPQGLEVRHLDDDRYRNVVGNLRYGTRQENEEDRKRNGKVCRGEKHAHAKLTEANVIAIRTSSEGPKTIAARFGVSPAHIHAVRTKRVWAHI